MKIRNSFVSNSSSTSFNLTDYKNVIEVATKMMEIFNVYWKVCIEGKNHPCYEKAMKWLREHKDFDGKIVIPWTTNYETRIVRLNKREIGVDTCNNIDWLDGGLIANGSFESLSYEEVEKACKGKETVSLDDV